jgi:hypothetical protein
MAWGGRNFDCHTGAGSTRYTSAPVSWPATDRPCTSRQTTSRHVARDPAIAYVGSNPMAAVAPLIAITESWSARFRPCRSLNAPMARPPTGRTRNAAPKTKNVSSSAEFKCFLGGKNFVASSGARKPKSAKSYHSSALPTVVAATTQTSRRVVGAAISPVDCRSSWCRLLGGDGGASESSSSTSMLEGEAGTRVGMIA